MIMFTQPLRIILPSHLGDSILRVLAPSYKHNKGTVYYTIVLAFEPAEAVLWDVLDWEIR